MPKSCFVISPIGDPGSATRRRADGILHEIIRPAMEPDYSVERADHDKAPGLVTESIIGKLLEADLVVADLTGQNANVMYELAIRHAAAKPTIQILEAGDKLPFDISAQNTIFFEPDLAGRTAAVKAIAAAAAAAHADASLGNPIRRALEIRAVAGASEPSRLILEMLTDIRRAVAELKANPSHVAARSPASVTASRAAGIVSTRVFGDANLRQLGVVSLTMSIDDDGAIDISGVFRDHPITAGVALVNWDVASDAELWRIGRDLVNELVKQIADITNQGKAP